MKFTRETFCEDAFLEECTKLRLRGERRALDLLRYPEPPDIALKRAGTLRALDYLTDLIQGEGLTLDDLLPVRARALAGSGEPLWGPGEHVTVAMLDLLNRFGVKP